MPSRALLQILTIWCPSMFVTSLLCAWCHVPLNMSLWAFMTWNVPCVNTVESLPILFIIQGLEDPRALIDNRGSFKNYREAFAQAKPPCIPYMWVFWMHTSHWKVCVFACLHFLLQFCYLAISACLHEVASYERPFSFYHSTYIAQRLSKWKNDTYCHI